MTAAISEYPVSKKPARERLDMRFDADTRARLERQAERFGDSLSAYIRRALIRQLEADEASDPSPPKPPGKPPPRK